MYGTVITGSFARRNRRDRVATVIALLAILIAPLTSLSLPDANASLSVTYNFDTPGDLLDNFNQRAPGVVTASQSTNGGISDSGAIATPGSEKSVFSSKSSYSLGPVGSTYTFSSFLQSVGNNGYSGMGFTSLSPATGTASGVYRPTDAIGISVHGGGFVLHNGATDVSGSWNADNAGVVSVKKAVVNDLLNSGSPDKWYKIIFKITRDSTSTFDTRVEVWPSSSTGALLRPSEADAIFEWNDISNSTLQSAPAIHSFINFSGDRVRYFDDFSINLAGGATVVEVGAPVVVSTSAQQLSGVVTADGEVTALGGAPLLERGFVYGTSPNPTLSDTKVLAPWSSGDGTGAFQAVSATLTTGTYYFRSFATNSALTSYGAESQQVVAGVAPPSGTVSIPNTGFEDGLTAWLRGSGVTAVGPTETLEIDSYTWVYGAYQTKSARLDPNGSSSTFASVLETNLGLSTSEVSSARAAFTGTPTNATWVSSEVTLQAGTTYRMAWNYTSTDYEPYNDGSITTLVPVTVPGTPVITINNSSTNNRWALLGFTNLGTGMYSTGSYGSTGWQFSTYQVSESGTYKLGFSIFNIGDESLSPVLLLDDGLGTVTKNGQAFNPVAPNDPSAPSLAEGISPTTQTLSGAIGSAVTPSTAFTASGMAGTISYAITAGTLPTGLSLNTSTGVISGTPTAKSSGNLTITATGSTSGTASATLNFEFKDPQSPFTLTSTSGTPGVALTLTTSGGSGAGLVSYTVTNGTATGCAISGGELTSTTPGTCLVTATKAGDSDYSPVSSSLTTVTFGETASGSISSPPSPTPAPIESPTPKPTLGPPSNGGQVSPSPSPAPEQKLGPINLIPPQTPNPGVVYSSTNPIPKLLIELLNKPLAYVLEQLTGSPILPELAPTDSIAYENGSPVQIQLVKTDDENGYVLIGDGWQVALEAADSSGAPLRIDDSGNIILNKDRFVQFSGSGFAPGSIVKVWLFSDPAEISEVIADASGNFLGEAQLPEGIPVGQHTVQLNGLTKDGQLRSVSLGVVVEPIAVVPAPVPFDFSGLMNMLWILAAGVLFFFFILWRRRKKEEEEVAIAVTDSSEDLIFASDAFEAQPTQQFPNDSRRKIGAAAPPNRKRFSFKPKGA